MERLARWYEPLVIIGRFLQPFLLLILRVYWGWLLFQTGLGKLQNIERVAEFFSSLGIPIPTFSAYLVGCVEMIGGIFLLFGFLSRLSALLIAIVLITAYFTAHQEAIFNLFHDPSLFIAEPPFLFFLTALIVFCFGPGVISIDWFLRKVVIGNPEKK